MAAVNPATPEQLAFIQQSYLIPETLSHVNDAEMESLFSKEGLTFKTSEETVQLRFQLNADRVDSLCIEMFKGDKYEFFA
ncbi:hypothetical protein [Simkania sp.]|uniref:hypothetical protein n=1 Tax=Simkania sp. TaxID=34094 RepID=UPI003B52187B